MASVRSRSRNFTAAEIVESFFTAGSDDDDISDGEIEDEREDETDVLGDVPRLAADRIEIEAARSESSTPSTSRSLDLDLDLGATSGSDQSRNLDLDTVSSAANSAMSDADDTDSEPEFYGPDHPVFEAETEVDEPQEPDNEMAVDSDEEDDTEWRRNTNNFPRVPRFTGRPGIKVPLPDDPTPLDIYKLFITDELINSWKTETNRYAREVINSKDHQLLSNRSRFKLWKPVVLREMWEFIAICLHIGINKKPTLHDYWARHPALHSSFAAKVMPRERFLSILAFFHIANNATFIPADRPEHDPIHKIRPFVDHLNTKFKELYDPEREVCIDEAMVPFKGRSRFKVFMKDKPTKWGFKLYELCESKSGYVYSLEVYCADKRLSNKPVDVTMRLLEPLLNKGHRLYVDNYYCCPELWSRMKDRSTMLVGTCRRNRVGMPADLFEGRQRAGDLDYRRKGQLIVTRWFDKREVTTLSSFHLPQLRETQGRYEVKQKPLAVIDYVNFMSGVDHSDQLLSFFPMRRKSQKWWKKPFFHLLTLVSIQTTILLNKHRQQHRRRVSNLASVVKDLIVSLVSHNVDYNAEEDTVNLPLARLKERHFIKLCPETDGAAARGKKAKRQCKVCADRAKKAGHSREQRKNQRKQTTTWCPVCKVGLCIDCFEIYHTQADYTN